MLISISRLFLNNINYIMTKVGEHITLDIIGTNKEYDPSVYEKVIHDIAKAAKVTILKYFKI